MGIMLCAVKVCGLRFSFSGFPQRMENLENENGHRKVIEHEKSAKVI